MFIIISGDVSATEVDLQKNWQNRAERVGHVIDV